MFTLVPRSKSTDNSTFKTCSIYRSGCALPDGLAGTYVDYETISKRWVEGFDIVDFHKFVKAGKLLPYTPFMSFSSEGSCEGYWEQQLGSCLQYTPDGALPPVDWWGIVDVKPFLPYYPDNPIWIAQKAAANLYSKGFDALTFLAELGETQRMFLNLGRNLISKRWWLTLGEFVTDVKNFSKKWKRNRFSKPIKRNTARWLEARYGWRTLIYDIEGLNDAVKRLTDHKDYKRFRANSFQGYEKVVSSENEFQQGQIKFRGLTTDTVSIGLAGSCVADFEPAVFSINPLVTGWELIPFSFVLDWFLSVGQALAAISLLAFNPAYAASYGFKIILTREFSTEISEVLNGWSSGSSYYEGSCKAVLEKRIPTDIPTTPYFNLRMDYAKIIDMIALIIMRIKRRK